MSCSWLLVFMISILQISKKQGELIVFSATQQRGVMSSVRQLINQDDYTFVLSIYKNKY
jgi:hypothetical protein